MKPILTYIKTKHIGMLILLIAIALASATFSLTKEIQGLNAILHKNCPLPPGVCPYQQAIPSQTIILTVIILVLAFLGTIMLLTDKITATISKEVMEKMKEEVEKLKGDERKLYEMIAFADGTIFQGDLVEKSGFTKVKVTRLLDRLEGKGLVERKRRGMSNIVLLKHLGK